MEHRLPRRRHPAPYVFAQGNHSPCELISEFLRCFDRVGMSPEKTDSHLCRDHSDCEDRRIGLTSPRSRLLQNRGTIRKTGTKASMDVSGVGGDMTMIGLFGVGFSQACCIRIRARTRTTNITSGSPHRLVRSPSTDDPRRGQARNELNATRRRTRVLGGTSTFRPSQPNPSKKSVQRGEKFVRTVSSPTFARH